MWPSCPQAKHGPCNCLGVPVGIIGGGRLTDSGVEGATGEVVGVGCWYGWYGRLYTADRNLLAGPFFFRAAFFSAAFSALFILFSSSESSASSSAVYSATTAHPNSERSAIFRSFCLSATIFLPLLSDCWIDSTLDASCDPS